MANMSASINRRYKETLGLGLMEYGLVGYTDRGGGNEVYTCYKGAVIMMDVSDIDGYGQPMQSGITVAADDVFLGICTEEVSVVAADTSQGDKKVVVATRGDHAFPVASITVTDIGALVYSADDGTLHLTVGDHLWIGHIVNVDATYAWVRIDNAAVMVSTGA